MYFACEPGPRPGECKRVCGSVTSWPVSYGSVGVRLDQTYEGGRCWVRLAARRGWGPGRGVFFPWVMNLRRAAASCQHDGKFPTLRAKAGGGGICQSGPVWAKGDLAVMGAKQVQTQGSQRWTQTVPSCRQPSSPGSNLFWVSLSPAHHSSSTLFRPLADRLQLSRRPRFAAILIQPRR